MSKTALADPPGRTGQAASRLPKAAIEPSFAYLSGRLAGVEARVRTAVQRRRADDPDPNDRFRGLYISDGQVDELLAPVAGRTTPLEVDGSLAEELRALEAKADAAEAAGADLRLRGLARAFGLDTYDVELLLVVLAPDLDPRFERLYGYLHDDVSRRRASTGLALELCGAGGSPGATRGRARLGPRGPLVVGGLVIVEDADRPFLTRSLRVPDRVAGHLLGDDTPDAALDGLLVDAVPAQVGDVAGFARALEAAFPLIYVRERPGASGHALARAALDRLGRPAVELDLARLDPADDPRAVAAAASREARLRGAGLLVGPVEALADRGPSAVRAFSEARPGVVLVGSRPWDPAWSREAALLVDAPVATVLQRHELWLAALDGAAPTSFDPALVTVAFRLTPDQIARAAAAARRTSIAAGRPLTVGEVAAGARAQNAAGLERLSRRIEPMARWSDLVLPRAVESQLHEITARARHRDRVVGEWGMGRRGERAIGITALFAGDSGTGKTMSAEVVAGDLGFDLYVIDLSTVVDKYIGETEKNLDRIFTEAAGVNGVLLFDEADAIFGKRSEVRDAHDRYANIESAYLLQRMETFDGLAVLATNLRANLDEAFTRRLDMVVDFPVPDEPARRALWDRCLGAVLPRSADVDLDFLAASFELAGGHIRSAAVTAAYLAAEAGQPVTMADLVGAVGREYRKLGRLCLEREFGPYLELVA